MNRRGGRPPLPRTVALRSAILAAIGEHGRVTSEDARAMGRALGAGPTAHTTALHRLLDRREISRVSYGVYGPPTERAAGPDVVRQWRADVPLSAAERAQGIELSDIDTSGRPTCRSQCRGGPRPCPWASCRYHLAVDVSRTGLLTATAPDVDVTTMTATCALDVADRGPRTLEEIGVLLSLTRERARQIEVVAMERVRPRMMEVCE